MAINEKVLAKALGKLDPTVPEHWTADGLPALEFVSKYARTDVTREQLTAFAPQFSQSNPSLEAPAKISETEEAPTVQPSEDVVEEEPQAEDEPEPMPAPQSELDQEIMLLDAEIGTGQSALSKAQAEVDAVKKTLDALIHQRDELVSRKEAMGDRHGNTHAIKEYLEGQKRIRAEKIASATQILKALGAGAIAPKAAIDMAMSRKNTRGAARPNIPFKRPSEA